MKKIAIIAVVCFLVFAGCTVNGNEAIENTEFPQINQEAEVDNEEMFAAIDDWILGTDYEITGIGITNSDTFSVTIPEEKYNELEDFEKDDIAAALINIGKTYGYDDCKVFFSYDKNKMEEYQSTANEDINTTETEEINDNVSYDGDRINLIFIHHSCGENWLNDGLNKKLNDNNIHVADTYYGWMDIGDYTDTINWPDWFNDDVMPTVYNELGTETAENSIEPAPCENTIIMFKSCFPNSDVGNSIDDEKAIYQSLLTYFSEHTDKVFVLITPPPMQYISNPEKTRELTNYLVDSNGWLKDYEHNNVFVFDFYNVLTSPDNHHMLVNNSEEHIVASSNNTLYYDSDGDDHPNYEGNSKAADEFVPLLIYWYEIFAQ